MKLDQLVNLIADANARNPKILDAAERPTILTIRIFQRPARAPEVSFTVETLPS